MAERGAEGVWGGKIRQSWKEAPYEPFDDIVPGDVVRLGRNNRKVRRVVRLPDTDHVHHIEVVKIRRSGYPSPTTYVDRAMMYQGEGYEFGGIVGRSPKCVTDFECRVQEQIEADQRDVSRRSDRITEKDVVGVLW